MDQALSKLGSSYQLWQYCSSESKIWMTVLLQKSTLRCYRNIAKTRPSPSNLITHSRNNNHFWNGKYSFLFTQTQTTPSTDCSYREGICLSNFLFRGSASWVSLKSQWEGAKLSCSDASSGGVALYLLTVEINYNEQSHLVNIRCKYVIRIDITVAWTDHGMNWLRIS